MAFDISLLINVPRSEKVSEAFSSFHTGMGMGFSQLAGMPSGTGEYQICALSDSFMRDPFTGIITLRPHFFQIDRYRAIEEMVIQGPDLISGGTIEYGAGGLPIGIIASAKTAGPPIVGYDTVMWPLKSASDVRLGVSTNPAFAAWETANSDCVWHIQTKKVLAPNQAWSVVVAPSGIHGDQPGKYYSIGFGGKFVLEISMSGVATLLGWNGSSLIDLQDFSLADGGVNMDKPFQVSCYMTSRRFMTIYFTQTNATGRRSSLNRAPTFNDQNQGFLVVLRGGNFEPHFDVSLGQYVKTDAAPLYFGIKKEHYRYDFIVMVGSHETADQALTLAPETMYKAPTWHSTFPTDGLKLRAEYGQTEPAGGAKASITGRLRDMQGGIYSSSPHYLRNVVVPEVTMRASATGLYSPELHSANVSYPAEVRTSEFTPYVASAQWQLIRVQKTVLPEPSRVEFKLIDDARWQQILKSDGPFRVTGKDAAGNTRVLADGYLRRKQPTIEGPSKIITNSAEGFDMFFRLDGTNFVCGALETAEIADEIRKAILTAGFVDSEVFVDYASSPELRNITFGKLRNPNDILRPNEDTSVGDFIRECVSKYGAQARAGIRVRWVEAPTDAGTPTGMRWRIYLGPIWKPGTTTPDCYFVFDRSIEPLLGTFTSDHDRYVARVYRATGTQEPTTLQPEFNEIVARAAADTSGHDANPERRIEVEARAVNDPTYVGYEGAANAKRLSPSDLSSVTSADSLEQQLRFYFDLHYNLKSLRTHEFEAEYRVETDCDQFAVILGLAPKADPDGRFAAGAPISYGVFRIDAIDSEIRADGPNVAGDPRGWENAGSYRLVFVNKWEKLTGPTPIKMFAPDNLLPLD